MRGLQGGRVRTTGQESGGMSGKSGEALTSRQAKNIYPLTEILRSGPEIMKSLKNYCVPILKDFALLIDTLHEILYIILLANHIMTNLVKKLRKRSVIHGLIMGRSQLHVSG